MGDEADLRAQCLRDVYGPAGPKEVVPEGTLVGTTYQFVGLSIGFGTQHLFQPDEANQLANLLREAAMKCRSITEHKERTIVDGHVIHLMDVYGPAGPWSGMHEGTTVGTTFQFVGFSIGWNHEHLIAPAAADKIADLLREAATKCRAITEAENRERIARYQKGL